MARSVRTVVTLAVLASLFLPVALDHDSLPLSTYPMYSSARPTTSTIVTAQHVIDEQRHPLSMMIIGESDDPLIVTGELRAAIRNGEAERRCLEIASRASTSTRQEGPGGQIEVVSERHDTVDYVADRPSLLDRTVHASCPLRP